MKKDNSPVFSVCRNQPDSENSCWQEYQRTGDPDLRRRLILDNIRLVYYAYGRMKARLPQGMEAEDAIGYGMTGLIEAVDRYRVEKGRFSSLAYLRIQGAIYDGMICFQWMKRHDQRLYQQWSRERRKTVGSDAPGFNECMEESSAAYPRPYRILIPLEQAWEVAEDTDRGPDCRIMEESDRIIIRQAVEELEEREADIIRRYYFKGQTFRQIAEETGRSTSRVSELHKKGLRELKVRLKKSGTF